MAYVSGDMKWLERCDRLNGGSISLKLAQVPVYLQDGWRWWGLLPRLPALTILIALVDRSSGIDGMVVRCFNRLAVI